jgi:hypothetical protein
MGINHNRYLSFTMLPHFAWDNLAGSIRLSAAVVQVLWLRCQTLRIILAHGTLAVLYSNGVASHLEASIDRGLGAATCMCRRLGVVVHRRL